MKFSFLKFAVWAVAFIFAAQGFSRAQTQRPAPDLQAPSVESYPWSEESDTARVPKSFLDQVTILSVGVTNYYANHQYVLKDNFIRIFKLAPSEITRVNDAIAKAIHEYRTLEGKHLEPTGEKPSLMRDPWNRPGVAEIHHFRMTSFPEEAKAIKQRLEETVLATLGEQRFKLRTTRSRAFRTNGTGERQFRAPSVSRREQRIKGRMGKETE